MKHYLLTLLIILIIIPAKAQNTDLYQWDYINLNTSDYSKVKLSQSINPKQALDSIRVYYPSPSFSNVRRIINTYGPYGNVLSEVNSMMDNTNNWIETEKKEHKLSYYPNGSIKVDTFYNSYSIQNYISKTRAINTYLNNQLVTSYYSSWDTLSSSWKLDGKSQKTYNSNNLILLDELHNWDNSNNSWKPYKKVDYSYDVNNNLTLKLYSGWNNAWVVEGRRQWFYNAQNKDTTFLISTWDTLAFHWLPYLMQQSTYDTSANLLSVLAKLAVNVAGQLENNSKDIYTYNSSNQLVLKTHQNWYIDSNDWKSMSKWEYAYDSHSNRIQEVYYIINASLTSWSKQSKTEYVYDNAYSFSDLLLPNEYEYDSIHYSHKLLYLKYYAWDFSNQNWHTGTESAYYYTEKTLLALQENSIDRYCVYPNPASEYIQIDLPKSMTKAILYIYDIQGKLILETNVLNNARINIQTLKSGLYIYKVCEEANIYTGKLIVE